MFQRMDSRRTLAWSTIVGSLHLNDFELVVRASSSLDHALAPDVVFAADVLQRQFGLEAQEFALDVAQQIGFAPFLVEVLCERLP
jgi:hypothetical protein